MEEKVGLFVPTVYGNTQHRWNPIREGVGHFIPAVHNWTGLGFRMTSIV